MDSFEYDTKVRKGLHKLGYWDGVFPISIPNPTQIRAWLRTQYGMITIIDSDGYPNPIYWSKVFSREIDTIYPPGNFQTYEEAERYLIYYIITKILQ